MFRFVGFSSFRLMPRRLSLSAVQLNVQFQSKLDSEIQTAVSNGLNSPSLIYDHLVKTAIINDDSFQRDVVKQLDTLNNRLIGYQPTSQATSSSASFFSSIFSKSAPKDTKLKRNIYIYRFSAVNTAF